MLPSSRAPLPVHRRHKGRVLMEAGTVCNTEASNGDAETGVQAHQLFLSRLTLLMLSRSRAGRQKSPREQPPYGRGW